MNLRNSHQFSLKARVRRVTPIFLTFQRRLRKELMSLVRDPPEGLKIPDSKSFGDDLSMYVYQQSTLSWPHGFFSEPQFDIAKSRENRISLMIAGCKQFS